MKILIIGAGLAGLYQAYNLLPNNHEITILEKEPDVGGQLQTIQYIKNGESYYFDFGPHIPPRCHNIWNSLCRKVDSIPMPLPLRVSIKLQENLNLIFPPDLSTIRSLRPLDLIRLIKYVPLYLLSSLFRRKEHSLEDSLINSWSTLFYNDFIYNFISTFWKAHPKTITKEYKARFTPPRLISILRKSLEAFRFSKKAQTPQNIYLYPKYGVGEVIQYLEKHLIKEGVIIKTNCTIKSLSSEESNIKVEYLQEGKSILEEFDKIYWSGSLIDIIKMLKLKGYDNLIYRKLLLINVAIHRKILFPSHVHCSYIMIPNTIVHRVYEPKKVSPYMAPPGKSSACLEITFKKTPDNLSEIISYALYEFRTLNNLKADEVELLGTMYTNEGYPLLLIDYIKYYTQLVHAIQDKFSNFYFIGRTGQFFPYTVGQALDSIIQ
jgi:protoporphyrinogen oxidase